MPTHRVIAFGWAVLLSVMFAACVRGSAGTEDGYREPRPRPRRPTGPPVTAPEPAYSRELPRFVQADTPPPPISGGTMAVSGSEVLVADPDTDRLHLVDLTRAAADAVVSTLVLDAGAEPGRVVSDSAGGWFVALRGGGAVLRVSGTPLAVDRSFGVCASPRGIMFDALRDELYVGCLQGALLVLDALGGGVNRDFELEYGIRDIVLVDDWVFVSHFRRPGVTFIRLDGLDTRPRWRSLGSNASAAYRMIALGGPDNEVAVLHQRVERPGYAGDAVYGYPAAEGEPAPLRPDACVAPIVSAALTIVRPDLVSSSQSLGGLTLPVDVAYREGRFSVVAAGARAEGRSSLVALAPAVSRFERGSFGPSFVAPPCNPEDHVIYDDDRRATATAFTADGRTLVLTRAPTELHVLEDDVFIPLPGPEVFDAGHDLFFGDASSGIACATCHPEGGEDGDVWSLVAGVPRRTPDLRGGVGSTTPLHWNGDVADFDALTREPSGFILDGVLAGDYFAALERYVESMTLPAREKGDVDAVDRGQILFESPEVRCAICHTGPAFTSTELFNVGTGGAFSPPALRGVALRAPYMHDGCAPTLDETLGGACGGELHGNFVILSPEQRTDLLAYVASL